MNLFSFMGKILLLSVNVKKYLISCFLNEYYRGRIKKIGKGVRFNGISRIYGLNKIEIGSNVHIGDNAFINGNGGLYIGDNTHISRNLVLYTCSHNYEGKALPYDETLIKKKVHIGKNVWIGMNVVILPGTTIEDGVIVGAGATVYGKIPSLSVIGSGGYQLIKKRNSEHYNLLEKNGSYGGINGFPLK